VSFNRRSKSERPLGSAAQRTGREAAEFGLNPYQPPASAYADAAGADGAVSNRIVEALRKTKPWVSLVSISGFVFAGFSVLIGLVLVIAAPDEEFGVGLGVGYLMWAFMTFAAALPLHRYARGIRKLLHGGGMAELEHALEAQTRFWQLAGALTLISVLFIVVGLLLMIIFAATLARVF
jgi:hypothetical protein